MGYALRDKRDPPSFPSATGIQHLRYPYSAGHHRKNRCLPIADAEDKAGNDHRDGSDRMNPGIVFLPDELRDAGDGV